MPRIPGKLLDSVFYLYPSVEDAKAGRNFGGTGFFVFYPASDGDVESGNITGWNYAVTNWHVAVRDGMSVIRINTTTGAPDIFDFGPEQWEFDPRFDIAVMRFDPQVGHHKFSVIPTRIFCSEFSFGNQDIGPGDDIFMAGRFIDHDGGVTNQPAVRFGHISINPTSMRQSTGVNADCYCIDVHSRTGYSGSPVFVFRTAGNDLDDLNIEGPSRGRDILISGTRYFGLLGIHFAQFPEMWELEKTKTSALPSESLISNSSVEYIKGMSGMTCVLPAWTIIEVLNMRILKKERGGREIKLTFGHHMNRRPDA
jgi:hypothetical protein